MKQMSYDILNNISDKEKAYFDKCLKEGANISYCGWYDFLKDTTIENHNSCYDGVDKL